jgi:hypothetical protein
VPICRRRWSQTSHTALEPWGQVAIQTPAGVPAQSALVLYQHMRPVALVLIYTRLIRVGVLLAAKAHSHQAHLGTRKPMCHACAPPLLSASLAHAHAPRCPSAICFPIRCRHTTCAACDLSWLELGMVTDRCSHSLPGPHPPHAPSATQLEPHSGGPQQASCCHVGSQVSDRVAIAQGLLQLHNTAVTVLRGELCTVHRCSSMLVSAHVYHLTAA